MKYPTNVMNKQELIIYVFIILIRVTIFFIKLNIIILQ